MGPIRIKLTKEQAALAGRIGARVLAAALVLFAVAKAEGWFKEHRDRRQVKAIDTLSPERLIARCGEASEDTVADVFPVVRRTMVYKAGSDKSVTLVFTRTADEDKNWVFLSMKSTPEEGAYDTAKEKVSVLPCLDSTK